MRRIPMIALGLILACIFLTAPVQAQDIGVDPSSFDFGPVKVGDSVSTIFTITGEGPGEAFIRSIEIDPNPDSAYSITDMPALPIFLPEGDEATVEVTYAPPGAGTHNASMGISSSDAGHPLTLVPLQGEGIPDPCAGLGGDTDGDGVCDDNDNCPNDANPDQRDVDSDTAGDVCDVCPSDPADECDPDMSVGCSIGSDGGTCSTPNERVTITIPPGALDDDTSLSITETGTSYEVSTNCGNGTALFGVELQPEGVTFNVPITIVFSWPDADNDGKIDGTNIQEKNVRISKDNDCITGQCSAEPVNGVGAECDMDGNTFSIEVNSFSVFTLFSLPSTSGGGGGAVGGVASMANKVELLAPWIGLTTLILLGIGVVVARRFKKQS
jgi:hypothetical protein